MFRRTTIVTVAVMVGLAAALTATPAYAVEVTPAPVSAAPVTSPAPCPLTESQLESGRQVVAQALRTVDHGWQVLDTGSGDARPELTPVANPVTVADAATCALAVADLTAKSTAAQVAVAQLGACLLTGAPCNPERSNATAALHAVEVALNNLKHACPWLTL